MTHETQASIEAWRRETFGPPSSAARMTARANEEMAELLREVTREDPDNARILVECADVLIVLYGVAELLDVALDDDSVFRYLRGGVSCREGALSVEAGYANGVLAMLFENLVRPDALASARRAIIVQIALSLDRLAVSAGGNLDDAVDAKMAINRARDWKLTDRGHGRHVGGEGA